MGCALPAVFCPWSCVSLPLVLGPPVFLFGVFVVLVLLPALLRVSFPWPSCASLCVVGFLCVCLLLDCCRLPSPAGCCFPPPLWLVPCGVLTQFLCWSLPLGIWLLCDGLVALPYCWGCGGALSSSLHFVSWQQRPLALCGVCFPSTP